ncbi:MAG: FitA-like ribbon-helix-helix domain-containing protein [Armatimonadota bacterium]
MAVRTQIYLPDALHSRLKRRAAILNRSMADQVREAVERYLETEEAPPAIPDDPIWRLPDHAIEGPGGSPTDVATRHDAHLYAWTRQKKSSRSAKPGRRGRQ